MDEQLKLDLSEIQAKEEIDSLNDEEEDGEDSILYKKRLNKLIKEIAEKENFDGIQNTKDGFERLLVTSKYLIAMLVFEIVEELKLTGRKQIKPIDVDRALDRITAQSSAIDIALKLLSEDIDKLKSLNKTTSVSKASNFINSYL